MSSSNPSRIPFEMMAAGLPVVELYRENNLYDLPDEGVLLAEPSPEAVANAILYLVDHPEVREKMSNFGTQFMKDYPLEKGFSQFLKAVDDMINTDYEEKTEIKRLYNKEPFKASEETTKVAIEGIEPVYIDTHGPIYRFLRRVKRLLKGWLIKLGIKKS